MTRSGPPNLVTAEHRASWLNRAGRTDRSACVELKASDLWRSIPRDRWQVFAAKPHKTTYRLATTTTDISAYELVAIHDAKNPYTLQGDLRTQKSNALKPQPKRPSTHTTKPSAPKNPRSPNAGSSPNIQTSGGGATFGGTTSGGPTSGHSHTSGDDSGDTSGGTSGGGGESNPNRGQSRTKMLGLPTDWSQPLTIQRWRLHEKLAQHFFACPKCKQRALKLFLPLCTEQELHDALTAQLWLDANHKRIATSSTLRPQASQLLARYAPIFPPRRLVCRKCLGLRYGEVRPGK